MDSKGQRRVGIHRSVEHQMSIAAQRVEGLKRCGRMEATEGTTGWEAHGVEANRVGKKVKGDPEMKAQIE